MQSRLLAILVAVALALVATAALVVYVNGADRRAIRDQQPVLVYVAKARIAAGTTGEQAQNRELIQHTELPRKAVARDAIRSLEQLGGRVAAVDIVAGEQLLATRWVAGDEVAGRNLLRIPPDHQAVSVELDATRQVSGFVTPGDHVSMVATLERPGSGDEVSRFLLQNLLVLAVGVTAQPNPAAQGGLVDQNRNRNRSQNLSSVTLAVLGKDVEKVVFAAEHGEVYLSLLPPGDQQPVATGGRDGNNVFQN
jgi:pilus assembly protein CpaB